MKLETLRTSAHQRAGRPSPALRSTALAVAWIVAALWPAAASADPGTVVFDDVRVVDVQAGKLLPGRRRVVIRDGRIDAIGLPDELPIPAGAEVIAGKGRYLAPGLVDMHVHLYGPFEEDLIPYLANGVTSVREMGGWRQTRLLRDAVEAGEKLGPRIFLSTWFNDGDPPLTPGNFVVTTKRQARRLTRDYAALGYDFIKIYTNLSREITDVFLKEGRRRGLPVVGHVPLAYPLRELLKTDFRSMEHLTGFQAAIERENSPYLGRWTFRRNIFSIPIYESEIPELAAEIAASGVWNCPTIVTSDQSARQEVMLARLERPEYRWVPAPLLDLWRRSDIPLLESFFINDGITEEEVILGRQRKRDIVRALHEAGARLLIGTDAPVNTVIPGLSLHQEMKNFTDAGLSPAEILRIATWNAARALGAEDEIGTVEPGKRADLILVRKNPLKAVGNAAKLQCVMIDGRWLQRHELRAMWRAAVDNYPHVDFTSAVAAH